MKKELIGGIVVLYKPDSNLIKNITSYLDQVDEVLLFDNSVEKKPWLQDYIASKNNIIYKTLNKNIGVAGALNFGAEYFIKSGYKWLLTLDQDSRASGEMVYKLFYAVGDKTNIGIISPYHVNKLDVNPKPEEDIQESLVVMTSGNLLNLNVYQQVGPFRNEFFIDYVDTEYCMRLRKNNFRVLRVNTVPLYHNEANVSRRRLFGKDVYPYNHAPQRLYFKVRNRFYLRDMYKNIFPDYFDYEYPLFRNMLYKILLFENQRFNKIRFGVKGFIDYKRGVNYSPFDK